MIESGYQIIARRFRPQTFKDVLGQDPIVKTLKNALRHHRIAQAYLFCGGMGTGKTTLARLLAKALNCDRLTNEYEPCNECSSCIDITTNKSLNVIEIDGASNRGIDDIRQINETVQYATLDGKYKIYIIDEVHMLTKEAFNALLKTLEEPPKNVKFFFATTEPHKVLGTITSRCQRFDLQRLSSLIIKQKLQEISQSMNAKIEEEALFLIAQKAEGSLRNGESLLDQMICLSDGQISAEMVKHHIGMIDSDFFFQIDIAIFNKDLSKAFTIAETFYEKGWNFSHLIDDLLKHFRQLLSLKYPLTLKGRDFINEEEKNTYTEHAKCYSEDQLLSIIDHLLSWIKKTSHINTLYLEMILLHLIRSSQILSIGMIATQLQEMEKKFSLPSSADTIPLAEESDKKPFIPKRKSEESPLPINDPPHISSPTTPLPKHRYDTLIRFAALELEGTIKEV
ncbi:MAG: DNA polymerase III subunit gamma/tau [Rhabdochlamydiaceae bacterium]